MKGFSFIELMICIAIIGIISAMAVEAYQHQDRKPKWSNEAIIAESKKCEEAGMNAYVPISGFNEVINVICIPKEQK